MMRVSVLLFLFAAAFLSNSAQAHELRPAYLDMRETADKTFSVVWKVPALGDMRLGLYLKLPESCKAATEPVRSIESGAYLERWTAVCGKGLKDQRIEVAGLAGTLTDALARIAYLNGNSEVARLTPQAPGFTVKGAQTTLEVAAAYFRLGVDHILGGIDHLLFILALLLLIADRWTLLKTITAFTLAHSITLSGAALGLLSLPQKPVEASIALSIAFVASELVKMKPGVLRLSERAPWLVAFVFGLLHGFGFAGALKEIGLPQTDIPVALLTFNLGVEAGQLLFVAGAILAWRLLSNIVSVPLAPARLAAAYLIGASAMVWLISRLGSFWA